jgi:class 3 adenylate cyclase
VVDAVRCAIEVQNGLTERNAGLPPECRIEFLVGIHLGDVVEESDGDLMGDCVNIAARLESIAKPGAICLSEQPYWQVKGRLDLASPISARPNSRTSPSRNTAFTYKGKPVDAKAIGKDLGVRYVLEGSVQPSAAEVRVNAQLIDADSGAHVWAEQFDTPRADVLQTQDEIVTHLAHALLFQLPEADLARTDR